MSFGFDKGKDLTAQQQAAQQQAVAATLSLEEPFPWLFEDFDLDFFGITAALTPIPQAAPDSTTV